MKKIRIFDSTLRDGAQAEGISFSVNDKIKIVEALDELGIDFIEAGNPSSNPKDLEFFEAVKKIKLKKSILVAFGATRRIGINVIDDQNVKSLLKAETQAVAIFGKSWDFHVTDIIKTTLEENLAMIYDTVSYLKENNKYVIYDAEHFFDGYKHNKEYAIKTILKAQEAKADVIALCDTNGGTFPDEVYEIVCEVKKYINVEISIHTHNDTGMAVANSIMAVKAGATQVQGTILGYGERCGNANLSTIIPNLMLKKGYDCIDKTKLEEFTAYMRYIAEISNINLLDQLPYVGSSAFAHKAGMHIDGVTKSSNSFEHVSPSSVGNSRRFLLSEVAGRSSIIGKIQKIDPSINKDDEVTKKIIDRIKELEYLGYQLEGADATFKIMVLKVLGKYKPFFNLERFRIIGDDPLGKQQVLSASAIVKIEVGGKSELKVAEGRGPINALDKALRESLEVFYPSIKNVHLTDYKVRVIDTAEASAAKVRVLIESSDGLNSWTTVGVSNDIVEASWIALVDSLEYKLINDLEKTGE